MQERPLPQPPPGNHFSEMDDEPSSSGWQLKWVIGTWIGVIVVILILWLLPRYQLRAHGKSDWIEVLSNARQLDIALSEFETEFGRFPDASTSEAVRQKSGATHPLSSRTSNDLFAQLFASGIVTTESMFYARAKTARRPPDGIFDSEATLLQHGECGFAYISGLSSKSDPNTPLIFGPVIPGTTSLDLITCHGKAVVLKADHSVTSLPINSEGKIIYNGLDLLDPRQPFWHGKAPDVKWPK